MTPENQHWLTRFQTEVAFARGLLELEPGLGQDAARALAASEQRVSDAAEKGDPESLRRAVLEAETSLAAFAEVARSYGIQCVGHAHIDMNWQWGWPETVQVTLDTFTTVLSLMREFPEFTFTQSQASVYRIVEEYAPELLKQIRERVAEGRWEVAAAHWVEGDRNLASGESLCRHLLYTRAFVKRLFDLDPESVPVDWSPDTFGHAATLPSIDAAGGVRFYYLCRGGKNKLPPLFRWRGPDGSEVIVNRETTWYINTVTPDLYRPALAFYRESGLKDWLYVYGVGDHGGGPTRRDLRRLVDQQAWPLLPRLSFSSARRYFESVAPRKDSLPLIEGELNFEFEGCYTSQSSIKRGHRESDRLLSRADTALALAFASSSVDRAQAAAASGRELRSLSEAWKNLLFCQFHDILPGSGVRATREHASGLFQAAQATGNSVLMSSLKRLAARVDTSFAAAPSETHLPEHESRSLGAGAGFGRSGGASVVTAGARPFVVFNPCAWSRRETIRACVWDGDEGPGPLPLHERNFVVQDASGNVHATQVVGNGEYWGHHYVELAFESQVEALGMTAYAVTERRSGEAAPAIPNSVTARQENGRFVLENSKLRVEIDEASGAVIAMREKTTGTSFEMAREKFARLCFARERHVKMSSWVQGDIDQRTELDAGEVSIVRSGPQLASVRARLQAASSKFEVTYSLSATSRALELEIRGSWLEQGDAERGIPKLELALNLPISEPKARYEIPFGAITRAAHERDVPALRWACVSGATPSGQNASITLWSDSKHGYGFDGKSLILSLIRSSYDPDPLPEITEHEIRCRLTLSSAAPDVAELARAASDADQPLIPLATSGHAGDLGSARSGVVLQAPGDVVVTQLKVAEHGAGIIVRCVNYGDAANPARLKFDELLFGQLTSAKMVDVLERESAGQAEVSENSVTFAVEARAMTTLELTFHAPGA